MGSRRTIRDEGFEMFHDIKATKRALRAAHEKLAVEWVHGNPLDYGVGYWNGFVSANTGSILMISDE